MSKNNLRGSLSRVLGSMKSIDFLIARELTMVIGVGSILYTTYSIGYTNGWEAYFSTLNNEPLLHVPWPHTINALHLIISIAFLISTLGLRSRTVRGFLISLIAQLTVAVCYAWWYYDSVLILRAQGVSDFSQINFGRPFNYAGGLREAIWWDMVVLAITGALLLWKTIYVMRALRKFSKMS